MLLLYSMYGPPAIRINMLVSSETECCGELILPDALPGPACKYANTWRGIATLDAPEAGRLVH